jgi:serine/threonine protein kinase
MKLGSNFVPEQVAASLDRVAPGRVLDGRFSIVEAIRSGGMGSIFKAHDLLNEGRWVALKVPHRTVETDPALFTRFLREEEIGTILDHPSIVKVFPVEDKSLLYLAMEFLEGETLYQRLKDHHPMPEAEALALASRICAPLQYMHERGYLHRDLKPENIMLCHDGSIRLMDFGIARLAHAKRLTFVGFMPGTPHYMAPERVNGKRGDARTDIYGLGAMLYEMLTGVIAFADDDITGIMDARVTGDPEPLRKLNPAISPQAEEIVLHAMERDLTERYQSIVTMRADLDAPAKVVLTERWRRMRPSTNWKRGMRKARTIALWCVLPVVLQVVIFLLVWHHLSKGHASVPLRHP